MNLKLDEMDAHVVCVVCVNGSLLSGCMRTTAQRWICAGLRVGVRPNKFKATIYPCLSGAPQEPLRGPSAASQGLSGASPEPLRSPSGASPEPQVPLKSLSAIPAGLRAMACTYAATSTYAPTKTIYEYIQSVHVSKEPHDFYAKSMRGSMRNLCATHALAQLVFKFANSIE